MSQHLIRDGLWRVRGLDHLLALIHAAKIPIASTTVARRIIRFVLLRACNLSAGGRAIGFLITGPENLREGRRETVSLQRHARVEEQAVDGFKLEHAL